MPKNVKCPHCGCSKSRAKDSRFREKENYKWRRLICYGCSKSYTTYEVSSEEYKRYLELKDHLGKDIERLKRYIQNQSLHIDSEFKDYIKRLS